MKVWKQLPYAWKVVLAFVIFFSTTLVFAYLKAKDTNPSIPIGQLAQSPKEAELWKGKPKVVYFWATWCGVCKAYEPILNANKRFLSKEAMFFSVVESEDPTERIPERNYPIHRASYELLKDWRVGAYPTTVFLDANDRIVFSDTGIISPIGFWLRSFFVGLL